MSWDSKNGLPQPFDGHNGTHDDCGICDGILAKRMLDMGIEPEWDDKGCTP